VCEGKALISLAGRTFVRLKKLAMGIPNAIGAPGPQARLLAG